MKKLLLLVTTLLFSIPSMASTLQSFTNISVNPLGTSDYRVVASIHLLFDAQFVDAIDSIAAREGLAKALKSLRLRDLTGENSIDVTKERILKYIIEHDVIKANKVQEVYITDLIVEYTGESKAYIRQAPSQKKQ
ncbi:hypothetical protein QX776_00095 [Alteromonadaceae bacterium BrNp21-10]|nr:hypothetical protein [Alteromonadaceae bacterium BrNp21-10]